MPPIKKIPTKKVEITKDTLIALIKCRNELYDIYDRFGGISNIHISKGLSHKNVDWKFINSWESANMKDETSPANNVNSESRALDTEVIAEYIVSHNKLTMGALRFLNPKEIKGRLYNLFDDDDIDEKKDKVSCYCDSDSLEELTVLLKHNFGVNFGDNTEWLESVTVREFLEVLYLVKDIWAEEACNGS